MFNSKVLHLKSTCSIIIIFAYCLILSGCMSSALQKDEKAQVSNGLKHVYYELMFAPPTVSHPYIFEVPDGWLMQDCQQETWSNIRWRSGISVIFSYWTDGGVAEQGSDPTRMSGFSEYNRLYRFDNNKNLFESLSQEVFDSWSSPWVNCDRDFYAYDDSNHQSGIFLQTWRDSAWVDDLIAVFARDVNGRLTEWMNLMYSYPDKEWNPSRKQTYSYDAKGRLVEELIQEFDLELGGRWKNMVRHTYSYNVQGNRIEIASDYEHRTDSWAVMEVDTTTYDRTGRVVSEVSHHPVIARVDKTTYLYYAHGIGTMSNNFWHKGSWHPREQMQVMYDEHGLPMLILNQEFNDGHWVDLSRKKISWRRAESK